MIRRLFFMVWLALFVASGTTMAQGIIPHGTGKSASTPKADKKKSTNTNSTRKRTVEPKKKTPSSSNSTSRQERQDDDEGSGNDVTNTTPVNRVVAKRYTVNGVSFDMVSVEGGTFNMGGSWEQSNAQDDEKPVHHVTISNYYIGQTEVTQALWKAVMGSNPSHFQGDNLPVESISWEDCQDFVSRLNTQLASQLGGSKFRLPTEAEWEFAARGGNHPLNNEYSGSSNLDGVAWYDDNSGQHTHAVGTRKPNELGIYDMSGNVCEWCLDWYGAYRSKDQTNPVGALSGAEHVSRGGCIYYDAERCRTAFRDRDKPDYKAQGLGLRLVLSDTELAQVPSGKVNQADVDDIQVTITGGIIFNMIGVKGGTFVMGATAEQQDPDGDEQPVHRVMLNSYYIGETEVTQALWQRVMGSNPSNNPGDNLPVENVSWSDCQEFIKKLNEIIGSGFGNKRFRLPTEAEWEYAARGGSKSRGYQFSGSHSLDKVAWYGTNSEYASHPVGIKDPNELGLYDMSGNVWEWCQDWHSRYEADDMVNPFGPLEGKVKILRGGSFNYGQREARLSYRMTSPPNDRYRAYGLRLVLSE